MTTDTLWHYLTGEHLPPQEEGSDLTVLPGNEEALQRELWQAHQAEYRRSQEADR